MVTYYLYYGQLVHSKKDRLGGYQLVVAEKPFAKAESIKIARVRAMTYLKRHSKTGGYVSICTANKEVEFVHMDITNKDNWSADLEVIYGKPSVGLRMGHKFTSSMDYNNNKWRDSRVILKDGSLGGEPNW